MDSISLPSGWIAGEYETNPSNTPPPESSDPARINLYGLTEGATAWRLYSIPAETPLAEIARFFKVGSHAETSYGRDPVEEVARVASTVTLIQEFIPCRVTYAGPAGMDLNFLRQITQEEVEQLEQLFLANGMDPGMDRYIAEWSGEGPMFAPVLQENVLELWWD
jgi:hypothetical protein